MADDYSANTSTTGRLAPGGQATGTLETVNDSDWFKLSATASTYYTVELSGLSGSYDRMLYLYDGNGSYLSSTYVSYSGTTTFAFKATISGDYHLAVRDYFYSSTFVPASYTLAAHAGVVDDIGDTGASAKLIGLDEKTKGVLEVDSDIDYFKLTVQAGVTYAIKTSWNPDGGTSGSSGSVSVEDPNGSYVSYTSSYSSGASFNYFTANTNGDYYTAVSAGSNGSIGYQITASAIADDHAANKAGAGTLVVGAAASTKQFEVGGDRDWYSVDLTANTTYWITLSKTSYSYGSALLRLLDADGKEVASNYNYSYRDANGAQLLQYVAARGGTYYVETGDSYSGSYAVRVVRAQADDHGDTVATATALLAGVSTSGKIAIPQDRDVFKLALTSGKTYLLEMTAADQTGSSYVELTPAAANGTYVAWNTYNKAGLTSYRVATANSTGDYYFTMSNGYSTGSYNYTIKVSEAPADDYAAGTASQGVLAVGSNASGVLDYIGDVDTFKVTLQSGAKYSFQLRGAASGEGTLAESGAMLQISNASGSSYSLTAAGTGYYTFTSGSSGDYYLTVKPVDSYYSSSTATPVGSYALQAVSLSGDTTAPTLAAYTPQDNAAPLSNITLRFSENVMRGTSSESITLRDSLGTVVDTFSLGDSRVTLSGNTVTLNPSSMLRPDSKYYLNVPSGAVQDLAGNKYAGEELLSIVTVATVTKGGAGNDYLVGIGNGIKLSGGGGIDTAIYGSYRSNYDVGRGDAASTVAYRYNSSASDKLDGIERLQFSDTSVALDIAGNGGKAYRLYQAAFDRTPDKSGLGYWISQLDQGVKLEDAARGFLASAEFNQLFGPAPSNAAFLTKLYDNVLGRAPDPAGYAYWLGALNNGAERAGLLAAFSESPENQTAIAQLIGNGFEYTPYG